MHTFIAVAGRVIVASMRKMANAMNPMGIAHLEPTVVIAAIADQPGSQPGNQLVVAVVSLLATTNGASQATTCAMATMTVGTLLTSKVV